MEQVLHFLQDAEFFYVATNEDGQPRVRPFNTVCEYNGKIYISTSKDKEVFNQLINNPRIEISAELERSFLRLSALAILDKDPKAKQKMIDDNYRSLLKLYPNGNENVVVFALSDVKGSIYNEGNEVTEFNF
ncbi:pyridoxamine 5'-phosphate oxidase family protein [Mycoplasma sp. P36-A1]|uniref:pyridoxamine 5'-phosphate oxidase family protein n=1 Tax=Mycoplasma sp. P36-A1 TaxID=3252900 RepID=UPI003C2D1E4C